MDRFSDDFMFQLNRGKFRNLMFQNGIPSFKAPFWHLKKWKVNMMKLKIWRACLTLAATLLINTSLFASDFYTCTRVVGVLCLEPLVDGDTIIVEKIGKVRLIGVDTPETKHPRKPVEYFGKEASAFTKKMVEGKKVRLEYDWQRKDRYGRVLAYVYVMTNDVKDMPEFKNRTSIELMLNAELIKQGYGHAYTRYSFKYLEQFRKYEEEARKNKRGLWK